MFCGGVFAFKNVSDDSFICSDGIEMSQKELLNIALSVANRIQKETLTSSLRRVLFVEASSSYIRYHRGCVVGVSTYQNYSIPLLCATMERVLSCINSIYSGSGDIDLQEYQTRSQLYHAIKMLLTNTAGGTISSQVTRSFNNTLDLCINPSISFKMEPRISGDFSAVSEKNNDSSTNETSFTDSMSLASSEYNLNIPDEQNEAHMQEPTVDGNITQEVEYNYVHNELQISDCSSSLELCALGGKDCGPLCFALVPASMIDDEKFNQNLLSMSPNGIYKCDNPLEQLKQMTKVVVFQTKVHPNEELPFTLFSQFEKLSDEKGKIQIKLKSIFKITDIIIGIDNTGFTNIEGNGCNVSFAGNRIILNVESMNDVNNECIISISGNISADYQPPSNLILRCVVHDYIFGKLILKTDPNGKFNVKTLSKKLFIQKAIHEFGETQ